LPKLGIFICARWRAGTNGPSSGGLAQFDFSEVFPLYLIPFFHQVRVADFKLSTIPFFSVSVFKAESKSPASRLEIPDRNVLLLSMPVSFIQVRTPGHFTHISTTPIVSALKNYNR
jgi:hypothetical protein